LLLAGLALCGVGPGARGDDKNVPGNNSGAIVVDPLDLRQPIADNEAALQEKYQGKTVQFSGALAAQGLEGKKKVHWLDLQTDVQVGESKGKPVKERIRVHVALAAEQKTLLSSKGSFTVTVEGTAVSLGQGKYALTIADAKLVSVKALPGKDAGVKR
jgi:hypothetical protein